MYQNVCSFDTLLFLVFNVTLCYRTPVTYAKGVLILPKIVMNSVLFLLCTRCVFFDAINLKKKNVFPGPNFVFRILYDSLLVCRVTRPYRNVILFPCITAMEPGRKTFVDPLHCLPIQILVKAWSVFFYISF